MKQFTGKDYLYIDIANHFGLDKLSFEDRIEFVKNNEDRLHQMLPKAEDKPLFAKSLMSLEDAKKGIPTGHRVGLDACASGTQIMSALIGCEQGAYITGLIDPDKRMDAYKILNEEMNELLGSDQKVKVKREDSKQAFMTFLYGSEAIPKQIFGEGTKQYRAFFESMANLVPGAMQVRQACIDLWQPFQDIHEYDLPDDFHVYLPNVVESVLLVEPEELEDVQIPVYVKEVKGARRSVSLAANIIHSVDGMVLRELVRRCDYAENKERIENVFLALCLHCGSKQATDYTQFLSFNAIHDIDLKHLKHYDMGLLCRLRDLCKDVLHWQSYPVEGNHDCFYSGANHMNKVRYWYKEILAELADSDLLQDIFNQIAGNRAPKVQKLSKGLGDKIRLSNYALS